MRHCVAQAMNIRSETLVPSVSQQLSVAQWLVCGVAGLGFLFDAYEVIVQTLAVRPALMSIAGLVPGTAEFNRWVGWLMFLPFLAGGIFGLLGGYLTDRFGRRRILVWSIVLYGCSAFASGCATSLAELLLWRCLTLIGVCTEYVAALAWIAELFHEPRRREAALGYTQAMCGLGGFTATGAYFLAVTYADALPPVMGMHEGWRYALIFGALPAIPALILRILLPESPEWQEKRRAGTLRRPRISELFAPALRRTTLASTALTAALYGVVYGVVQHIPRIVPGLPHVRELSPVRQEQMVSFMHLFQDLGHTAGRLLLAFLIVRLLWDRRRLLGAFQIPALILTPTVLLLAPQLPPWLLQLGIFVIVMLMTFQLSFIGNYLPQAYPTHLRGTGEGFALNIGGRILGPIAVLLTTQLANVAPGAGATEKLAFAAAVTSVVAYFLAWAIGSRLPDLRQSREER
jgi:MFS family permease